MTPTRGGRGHYIVPAVSAVSALLVLLGVAAVAWALINQQGDPPAPEPTTSAASIDGRQESRLAMVNEAPGSARDDAVATRSQSASSREDSAAPSAEPEPEPLSMDRSDPIAVRISSIDVSSDLHSLGLTDDGALDVPSGDLYNQAAWYEGSPTPGEIGPAVIEGHVTSKGSIPSVFFDLGAVATGDRIEVDREDGTTAIFEVYDTGSFPKDDFPSLAVYGRTNNAELRVITCGGNYSAEQRRHVDNVVVFARLVDAA
ncbi:MAG: class F sortase [Ornithinimicrobium sp.]